MVAIVEVATPAIAGEQVLVRVCATTVNRTDCGFRAAKPFLVRLFTGLKRPPATILGGEFAGVIEAVGAGVTSLRLGDRVFGYRGFGAHAQYLSMPANGRIATIPAATAFEQAAAGTEGSQYALSFIQTAKVRAGQHVLVYGATGAIGSAAVQFGYLRRLMDSGQFTPVIDRVYALDQIVEAYRYVETGRKLGNVVISVQQSS